MRRTVVRSLLDTNVLVYADSSDEPQRQRRAIDLLREHRAAGTAVLSTQVLQEYTNVALRKLGLPPALVRERLAFYGGFDLVPTTPALLARMTSAKPRATAPSALAAMEVFGRNTTRRKLHPPLPARHEDFHCSSSISGCG